MVGLKAKPYVCDTYGWPEGPAIITPDSYFASGFHRPLGVVPPASPGHLHYPPSPLYYSTPYYSPSHFYPDKLYQCWPPPNPHTYGGTN